MEFDLLSLVESGGCSIKFSSDKLKEALAVLPKSSHERLLVDIDTHDDAGVYKLTEDIALIQTTDFFSPVCSDPFEFGQIAAANALSDVYAMGGQAITALNLVMFPANIPLDVLRKILAGGMDKVQEANALIVGGHTIEDFPPKYGLAVTGLVHPAKVITNNCARPGEKLVLTKPIGTGVLVAAKKLNEIDDKYYQNTLNIMKLLNKRASEVMQEFEIRCATDITGFSLLGHVLKLAQASQVSIKLQSLDVPLLDKSYDLTEKGCIPSACFKNQDFVQKDDYNRKMLLLDAQTSGGIVMMVSDEKIKQVTDKLQKVGYFHTTVIGEVTEKEEKSLYVV